MASKLTERETDLVRACLSFLEMKGIFAWRCNTGAMHKGGSFVRFGLPGTPDIIGILPGGRFIGVECKVNSNKLSPQQVEFRRRTVAAGGVYVEARNLDDLMDAIQGEQG